MGKNSLIKSTSKKKKTAKSETAENQSPVKSKQAKTQTAAKTKKPEKAPKTVTAKASALPAKATETPKPPALRDLVLKKFEPLATQYAVFTPSDTSALKTYAAPPSIAHSDANEMDRMKKLLFNTYSMADLTAAAEKAAAEKAAAEKAAAEKAAAEKAAAEKAAAEKAAAEKAAAEKAAAEKAAAEKAAAVPPPPVKKPRKPADPQETAMKIGLGVFALIILYLIAVSYANMNTFHLKGKNGAVEVWQGRFSPMGEKLALVLPGAIVPDVMKNAGSKKDIFPFIAGYYINKADLIYEVPGTPDFQSIESYLDQARPYAVNPELKDAIHARKTAIDFTSLLNKAESAITSGTPEGLEDALNYLGQAQKLGLDGMKSELLEKKIKAVEAMKEGFSS